MCGLVGIMSSNMLMKHKEALSAMLYLDTWRGRDSTGVAAIRFNADTAILKQTVPGYEFTEGPKLGEFLRLNDFLWIGHNRFGTVGKNIKSNAHPFSIDDDGGACLVVGAHNGTLKNKHVLKDHAAFGTDSEALYNNIAEEGLEATIPKIEGAWALTYYDHIEEELRILRNKERTLFYAWEKGRKSFIWASEMWMIRVACSRAEIEIEEDKVFSFNEDTLYRIPAPDKMNDVLEMHRKGGLVGKTSTFFQTGFHRDHDGWNNRRPAQAPHQARTQGTQTPGVPLLRIPEASSSTTNNESNGTKQEKKNKEKSSKPSVSEPSASPNVVPLNGRMYKGYAGVLLTKMELEQQLDNGCGWCEKEFITLNERYGWLAPHKPVCQKCLDGTDEDQKSLDAIFVETEKKRVIN